MGRLAKAESESATLRRAAGPSRAEKDKREPLIVWNFPTCSLLKRSQLLRGGNYRVHLTDEKTEARESLSGFGQLQGTGSQPKAAETIKTFI